MAKKQQIKRKYRFQTVDELRECLADVGRQEGLDSTCMYVYLPNGKDISEFVIRTETLSDGSRVENIHFKDD